MCSQIEFGGDRDHTGELCRHCDALAAIRLEMGPIVLTLCEEHATEEMLDGSKGVRI